MLPPLNQNGDLPAGIHAADWAELMQRFGAGSEARHSGGMTMMHDDQELAVARERVARLEKLLEALRKTARPEEWAALSSGYRLEIERMQGEILDYLVQDLTAANRGAAA